VTHVIGLRKNTLTKTFGTQSPYLLTGTIELIKHGNEEVIRQEHTVNSNRHVSPHVLSTDCRGESTNAAATLPRCSGLSSWRTSQNNFKNIIFTKKIHRKILGKKTKITDLAMTVI